ncbi:DUF6434 domain-containing protein [Lentilitoribacter sp. EG35]|uniref:DUF6434 domain-containing protein n=1 Tax=Lentilitoribacter sp. EG35 TaxID=3234192 RepID=UPI0034603C3E
MMDNKETERPEITSIKSGDELRRWYWLKSDLIGYARILGVKTSCGKFEILGRISHYLDTGEKEQKFASKPESKRSKFDWHSEVLTAETQITDSYKNTQNVRRFFKEHVGASFKFNIEFMAWMKSNIGRTLGDAVNEYQAMKTRMSDPDFKSKIEDHNQFNSYTRDFLADNPDMGMSDVRKYWALKTSLPSDSGRHEYERSDLDLK